MAGKVGFIGLGAMGGPMALNLAKAGFALVVHDIDQAKTEPLRRKGAEVAGIGARRWRRRWSAPSSSSRPPSRPNR